MALKPASSSPVSRSKATPKTNKNSLAVLQCSLQNKWEVVYAGLSKISYVSTILDQERQKYPINSSLQNRKTAAKKNIKTLSVTFQNIQALLKDGSAAIEAADSICCSSRPS